MRTYIGIHSQNLLHNLDQFHRITGRKLMIAVKANAYGHGLREVVRITRNHPQLGYFVVDTVAEAAAVRTLAGDVPILLIGWTDEPDLKKALKMRLETIVHSLDSWKLLLKVIGRSSLSARVHLKIETGTARLGLHPEEALAIVRGQRPPSVSIAGVYSHFANIEDTSDHSFANLQMSIFRSFIDQAQLTDFVRHFSCSASALLFPETYFDMVRIGISAYGHWPSKQTYLSYLEQKGKPIQLRPVLEWITHIAQLRTLEKGSSVGYGLTYKTLQKTSIAVLPVGYADGYDRGLSSVGRVLIKGESAPIRGRICMNMMMVDVTHIPGVQVGDPVTLIGRNGEEQVTAEDLAETVHSIQYEILARISPLLPRLVVD